MRLVRRSWLLLVVVRAQDLKIPIIVPVPLAILEELLQAIMVVSWLVTGGGKRVRTTHIHTVRWALCEGARVSPNSIRRIVRYVPESVRSMCQGTWGAQLWRFCALARQALHTMRSIGPFDVVDVQTPEARVLIKMV